MLTVPGSVVKMPVVARPSCFLAMVLAATSILLADKTGSLRAYSGVVPAWLSRPLTVILNHLNAWTPIFHC